MNLRDEIRLLKRIFELLGPLRRMFVLSLGLMAIQAIWTGVVLGALGLFLQLALGSQGGAPVTAGPKLLALLTPMVDFLERFSPTKRILIGFGAFSL